MQSDSDDLCWDGITQSASLDLDTLTVRTQLADWARNYEWTDVIRVLSENPCFVNASRPDGKSRYSPLHQAAHGCASVEVITKLLDFGAFRSLRSADGKRPVDIAREKGHLMIVPMLDPLRCRSVHKEVLLAIQSRFYEVICGRVDELVKEHALRLPELDVLLEFAKRKFWFPVPGMAGGFCFWLESEGDDAKLVSESWSRMVGGSGERHEITSHSTKLVAEGFI